METMESPAVQAQASASYAPGERLSRLMAPDVYRGISMDEYLNIQAVSASVIRTIINECPRAALHESWLNTSRVNETSDTTDVGTIAHSILLEGSSDCVTVIDPEDHPAEKTGAIPNGWTNKSIRAARDEARRAGKIPVLPCDMEIIGAMVDSAWAYIASLRESEPAIWAAFQPDGGDSELTCVWDDDGTLCRMRPDRISKDRRVIIDPKFTKRAAEPDSWGRTQLSPMGYRISAAFYRRGCRALFNTNPDYVFLVVEQEAPHLCSLVGVDPAGLAIGAEQVEHGLRSWRRCVNDASWPAYPRKVCYIEPAPWEMQQWEDRQINEGIDYGAQA